jgi:SAM-dependent methyltransferase
MSNAYWSNFRGMTVDAYVEHFVNASAVDRQRMQETAAALPAEITTLLDVGCGYGQFLRVVRDMRGIAGTGVEITAEKVEYMRRALDVDARIASVDALPFSDCAFDAVCALEVIEHLPLDEYDKGRAEMGRVAGSWIIVSVPWRERRRNVKCPACGCAFNHNYHLRSFHDSDFPSLFPGFALRSLSSMGERRAAPAWIEVLGAWRRRELPPFAVCPACGFRRTGPAEQTPLDAAPAGGRRKGATQLRKLARHLFSRRTPCWYLALFERIGLPEHATGPVVAK